MTLIKKLWDWFCIVVLTFLLVLGVLVYFIFHSHTTIEVKKFSIQWIDIGEDCECEEYDEYLICECYYPVVG